MLIEAQNGVWNISSENNLKKRFIFYLLHS